MWSQKTKTVLRQIFIQKSMNQGVHGLFLAWKILEVLVINPKQQDDKREKVHEKPSEFVPFFVVVDLFWSVRHSIVILDFKCKEKHYLIN